MIQAWDYLSRNEPVQWFWCCQCGETFPLRSGSLFCLFLPTTYAAYVTGADSCDSFVWQSITLNEEDGMLTVRDWGPKFSWSSHKPCLSLDDMSLISHCYFHNSCRSQLKFSGHIQPVYNNHWLDHEFETKSNLCKFAKDLISMINIMPSHSNFHPQRENRALLSAFFCRRSFRDNFPRNYWAIKKTCSLCLYDPSDLCKSHGFNHD